MAKEIEITFKYDDGEEATIAANVHSVPTPRTSPPSYFFSFSSYTEKRGTFKFGKSKIDSGTFKFFDEEIFHNELKDTFNIQPSNCSFEKDSERYIYHLNIYSIKEGSYIPYF